MRETVDYLAASGAPVRVMSGSDAVTATRGDLQLVALRVAGSGRRLVLTQVCSDTGSALTGLSAAIEAQLGSEPALDRVELDLGSDANLTEAAIRAGLVLATEQGLVARADLAMQRRANWLADAASEPYPLDYVLSGGKRHPRRPPKPTGLAYARHISWLGRTVSFRALSLDDLPLFNRWMNDPRVASFWNEEGDTERHRAYLAGLIADPHMLPMIGSFDDRPFAYFELYWAKENRIAPFYDVDDWDRGWHVAVGDESVRGRAYISAWLPSLMHYMFLDDPRTQRIVGEPAASHSQQIRNLEVSGFAKLKNFDFPHKRATLVMLLRERFFGDRLWLPARGPDATRAETQ